MENKLKSLSTQELQEIISKAVSSSINISLEGDITAISYDEKWTTATFKITLTHPIRDELKGFFKPTEK